MSFLDIFKALFIPAAIAAAIYGLCVYVILPLYRHNHARYSQYLPLGSLSSQTSNFRSRVSNTLTRWLIPAHMRWRHDMGDERDGGVVDDRRGSGSGDELFFGEEEGESMVGFDVGRVDRTIRGGTVVAHSEIDSERRLSRDLEEGFKDDSDDDEPGDDRRR